MIPTIGFMVALIGLMVGFHTIARAAPHMGNKKLAVFFNGTSVVVSTISMIILAWLAYDLLMAGVEATEAASALNESLDELRW